MYSLCLILSVLSSGFGLFFFDINQTLSIKMSNKNKQTISDNLLIWPIMSFMFIEYMSDSYIFAGVVAVVITVIIFFLEDNNKTKKVLNDTSSDETQSVIPSDQWFRSQGWVLGDWFNHDNLSRAYLQLKGVDHSRVLFQKVAYEITKAHYPTAQKEWFKSLMAKFVMSDYFYTQSIDNIKNAVKDKPGLLQSSIYKNRTAREKENARYVLYFADYLGDIKREKSGNSYRLYPANPYPNVNITDPRRLP